ncbi:MAG: hypothetical protein R3E66_14335 [bacterium]
MDENRPLDSLIPELSRSQPIEGMPQGPEVHAQVFEVQLEEGHEWLYSMWREPEELSAMEAQIRRLLEITQLLYLSHDAEHETPYDFRGVRLLVFDSLSVGAERVLGSFGLVRTPFDAEQFQNRMLSIENQAMQAGWSIPKRPTSVWHAEIGQPDEALEGPLRRIEKRLHEALLANRWGEVPGETSKLLADQIKIHFGVTITPDRAGLDQLDVLLLDHSAHRFRWMLPSTFKALCDFVGVYMQATQRMQVGWAVGKAGNDFPAPPLFRVSTKNGPRMFPIGQEIIRWSVLPNDDVNAGRMLSDRLDESFKRLTS